MIIRKHSPPLTEKKVSDAFHAALRAERVFNVTNVLIGLRVVDDRRGAASRKMVIAIIFSNRSDIEVLPSLFTRATGLDSKRPITSRQSYDCRSLGEETSNANHVIPII